jgi:hypothetical protein
MTEQEILERYSTQNLRRGGNPTNAQNAPAGKDLNVIPRQRCTFVAVFSDGVVVSQPTAWNGGNPSVENAVFFAQLAYKRRTDKSAPTIVEARFEVGRKPSRTVLRVCSAAELNTEQVFVPASEPEPVQRKRGRPKGSKNKPKTIDDTSTSTATAPVMHKASRHEKPRLALIAVDGGMPVFAPLATLDAPEPAPNSLPTEWTLEYALGVVKAAGYRVSKLRGKYAPRYRDRVGPTIVCRFSDGEITRMSVNTTRENLDWYRGELLARAAWRSRWRRRQRIYTPYPVVEPVPPAIVEAHFEEPDGRVLARRPDSGSVS